MDIVVKIDFGFGKRDVRWDGKAFLEKGTIARAAGCGSAKNCSSMPSGMTRTLSASTPQRATTSRLTASVVVITSRARRADRGSIDR